LHPFGSDANAAWGGADYAFMPHIRLIDVDEATGLLAEEYTAAMGRAGKVFNIVKSMSLNPRVLGCSMGLYKAIMFGPSQLSRVERELLAVVVSNANDCHY
jgi:alkylhydroperoxidase family enzyme